MEACDFDEPNSKYNSDYDEYSDYDVDALQCLDWCQSRAKFIRYAVGCTFSPYDLSCWFVKKDTDLGRIYNESRGFEDKEYDNVRKINESREDYLGQDTCWKFQLGYLFLNLHQIAKFNHTLYSQFEVFFYL